MGVTYLLLRVSMVALTMTGAGGAKHKQEHTLANFLMHSDDRDRRDSPLHHACRNGSIDIVRALLDEHAGEALDSMLEERGMGGHTSLLAAVVAEEDEIAAYLVERGANVSAVDRDGYNAMHMAAYFGKSKMVNLLHKRGLDILAAHHDGYAPIHRAVWGMEHKHTDTVASILRLTKGDAVYTKLINGKLPIDIARNKQTIRLLKQWQKKSDKKYTSQYWIFIFPMVLLLTLAAYLMSQRIKGRVGEFNRSDRSDKGRRDRAGGGGGDTAERIPDLSMFKQD
jgi:Ankyrin repeats (3 copies)